MKRLLFLDDNPKRHRLFVQRREDADTRVVPAFTAAQAIELLQQGRYDEVHLDHDLKDAHYLRYNPNDTDTGMAVVDWIIANRERFLTTDFVIHSWNDKASWDMFLKLRGVRLRSDVIEFDEMETV